MPDTAASPRASPPAGIAAEAARYALLRRLAPSMRHHLVVNLQPIGMICEVIERRLRAPAPDLAHVQDSAGKINGFAKAALAACVDVVGWLAPDDSTTTLEAALRESTSLLATSFGFRGYALRGEAQPSAGTLRRMPIRSLLPAALIHCTDEQPAPADLVVRCVAEPDAGLVQVTVQPTQGGQAVVMEPAYRKITWADVQALADAEGVQLQRDGACLSLRFPWVAPPAG
jgi:hypothetical protein